MPSIVSIMILLVALFSARQTHAFSVPSAFSRTTTVSNHKSPNPTTPSYHYSHRTRLSSQLQEESPAKIETANKNATVSTPSNASSTTTLTTPPKGISRSAGPATMVRESLDVEDRPSIESGLRYSSEDWFRSFSSLYRSYVLRRIKNHLFFTTTISAIVTAIYQLSSWKSIAIPLLGHTLMGGFLSLMLVFRTNTAYARFWEARGMWSLAMKVCRGLAIDVVAHIRPHSPASAESLLQLISMYPDALTYTCLARSYPLAKNVQQVVQARTQGHANVPPATVICLMLQETLREAEHESETIQSNYLESLHHSTIAHDINGLTRIFSACEKIVTTPVPWSYSRHLSRFLTLWTGSLPLAIVGTLGWLTIPATAILCWALYGIEEIGHLIEQPFVGNPNTDRDMKTKPYDIGLPVFILANQIRHEVDQIAHIPETSAIH